MNPRHSSKSDSWMTPVEIIERARQLLGVIDLDPASSAKADTRVKARAYYTKEVDGWVGPCNLLRRLG